MPRKKKAKVQDILIEEKTGELVSTHEKPEKPYYQGSDGSVKFAEQQSAPALVISRLIQPVTLTYGGRAMIIPPRGKRKIANRHRLGRLPKGVTVKPI